MILTNAEYGLRIEFIEGRSCKLILENPKDMAYLAEVLCGQCAGKEGDFLLSCQEKEYKIEKYMEVIVNPFNIDFKVISSEIPLALADGMNGECRIYKYE